ncbi:aromatic acid exporter family protein [Acetobacter sp. DmW_043]|uniref:FUSC family protein n=1 Tax=Acetobacter sp. DmW_043 TaxID=1670658 RepID=UPI001E48AE38|nr:FUSC family protein [Acetobacter sp. DmW_043]
MQIPSSCYPSYWLRNQTLRQAIRLIVSVALCCLVTQVTHLQEPAWALITSVIVTQSSITETMSSGRYQLVGTLIGACASVVPITLMLLHWPLWLSFSITFVPLAILASWRPNTRMAVVTLMIATLFPIEGDPYLRPVERVLAILFGVSVSMFVSYMVLHEQARRDAFRNAAETVRKIVGILSHAKRHDLAWSEFQDLNDDCAAVLRKVQTAVEEARRERWVPLEERDPMLASLPTALRQLQMDTIVVARAIILRQAGDILKPQTMASFDWIIARCEAEAVSRKATKPDIAAEIIATLPAESDHPDEVVRFVLAILRKDLITLIHQLGGDDLSV